MAAPIRSDLLLHPSKHTLEPSANRCLRVSEDRLALQDIAKPEPLRLEVEQLGGRAGGNPSLTSMPFS